NKAAVHVTRMRVGEGLVGRVARSGRPINTADAPGTRGFRFMPETGEEVFSSFLGVPVQRLGEVKGVLVVQSKQAREYSEDELYALEVVAMVLAEMAELGAFIGEGEALRAPHKNQVMLRGGVAQEGVAAGQVWLHEPRVVIARPVADDPEAERKRLHAAVDRLRLSVDEMLRMTPAHDGEQMEVLEAYRMFANSKGWMRRMEEDIDRGLSAEAAVEKEQSAARARMSQVGDAYLRERLHDLDDLSNRLLRLLTGQGSETGATLPENPILIARNIGPAELLDYGRKLKGIVLEEGSVGSHATVVARALAIPLVINARRITTEALNGDTILVDGEQGVVHLRPDDTVQAAFRDKMAMQAKAQERYASLRDLPAEALCGTVVRLDMNAGLMADLPSLKGSGASGVGLFRTELQFLVRSKVPRRGELAALYARVMDAAEGRRVAFRPLDIGSDKVLPYMKPTEEPNPALGWRAIRVGLDKPGVMRMQLQALIRAANGRPLTVMFPFIAQLEEFTQARDHLMRELDREAALGRVLPETVEVGAMLETPSLAFAPRHFFELADFISIGGNDLKQFFFAADRENERVRRRYDTLNTSFLSFIEQIVARCAETDTPLSFCGEDAGRPIEALALTAMGLRALSMRPASIGPVKHLLRRSDLREVRAVITEAREMGAMTVRPALMDWLKRQG
ncbi:MAG: phosphoenolpyruvate--protein phosphotransferase, partial [Roseicyclus sp.]|nr:phosphoenolpyruvate--protein phosphotransferase [Roseicyclus sp.]